MLVAILLCFSLPDAVDSRWESSLKMWSNKEEANPSDGSVGTRWAVLIAGSSGFWNYRHQVEFFLIPCFITHRFGTFIRRDFEGRWQRKSCFSRCD